MTKVFVTDVSKLNSDLGFYKGKVSDLRLEKASKYRDDIRRLSSLGCELLLAEYLGRVPCYKIDKWGKPCGEEIEFNFSHSGSISLCAISDKPLGADVEKVREINLSVAKKKFHPDEYERILNDSDPKTKFFEYWTKKESYLKALGMGLRIPLGDFDVDKINDWIFTEYQVGEYKICICSFDRAEFIMV